MLSMIIAFNVGMLFDNGADPFLYLLLLKWSLLDQLELTVRWAQLDAGIILHFDPDLGVAKGYRFQTSCPCRWVV